MLLVKAACLPGRGTLHVTGTAGPMMPESAKVAMTWVRSHAERLVGAARVGDSTYVHLAEVARWKGRPVGGGGAGHRPGLGADRTTGAERRRDDRGADARGDGRGGLTSRTCSNQLQHHVASPSPPPTARALSNARRGNGACSDPARGGTLADDPRDRGGVRRETGMDQVDDPVRVLRRAHGGGPPMRDVRAGLRNLLHATLGGRGLHQGGADGKREASR